MLLSYIGIAYKPFRHITMNWMNSIRCSTFFLSLMISAGILTSPSLARADAAIATLYSLEGSAEQRAASSSAWKPCVVGDKFELGDEIRVGAYSRAGIQFQDGMFIRLSSKAALKFDRLRGTQGNYSVFLESGKGHFLNREKIDGAKVETIHLTAAIRGTEFVIEAGPQSSAVTVIEGTVAASNQFGAIELQNQEQAVARTGQPPQKSLNFSPADAVQWTAEIPVAFDWDLYGGVDEIRQRILTEGLAAGLTELRKRPADTGRALLETDLLLALGQIDEARAVAYRKTPAGGNGQAHAHAQRAMLALARNEFDRARAEIAEARSMQAGALGVALASSYVLQAGRDLTGALKAIELGLERNPTNAPLLSRRAELNLGFGKREEALLDIERALRDDPDNGYAHTVRGFILLMRGQVDDARESFDRGTALIPGNGLPYLGRGLATIHDGNLGDGRVDLQRAVHLEPNRALFRSYLGKAFFELEDEALAKREYDEAIRLDPNDPTAYLYRGFYNISQNRLVDALDDVETSFALNDNRAVFRSSLLLDDDSAVRSAGLSRVFTELGFAEAGRLEAIRALNSDPTNYSAHRLLADSQSEIFYADASLSERRIADLLAPLSFNLFSALGGQASLNEYDALFDKSERRTGVSFEYDERDDAFIGRATHSGKQDNLGYALSASTIYGHGRKGSSFLRDNRIDAALRYQLLPNHRILLDGHGLYRKDHEVFDFDGEDTSEFDSGGLNLGYSYRASSALTLISEASLSRERLQFKSFPQSRIIDSTQIFEGIEDTLADELTLDQSAREYVTAFRQGSQVLYRSKIISLVGGYQLLHESPDRSERSLVVDDSLGELTDQGLELTSDASKELTATDLYIYPTFHLLPGLDLTAGITRTDLQTSPEVAPYFPDRSSDGHWSPKIGLIATPVEGLTLRGAYFENLRKSSLEDQISLEPTLVSGMTQRFSDLSGTRSRNFAAGADFKVAGSTYIGGEFTRRYLRERIAEVNTELITDIDLQEQFVDLSVGDQIDTYVEQDLIQAYLYQVISRSFAAAFDYLYTTEELTDPDAFSDFLSHRASAQLKYFHSTGLYAYSRATWRKHAGINDPELPDGSGVGWSLDAGLGYRLPNRRGNIAFEILNIADNDVNLSQSRGFEDFVTSERAFRVLASFNF